jgi:bifunctional ADP-heptose synthase (sugar kinase/adenylyltransferase)
VINYIHAGAETHSDLRYQGDPLHPEVMSLDEIILRFGREKRNGKRVVFTNGCFDLLHPGHIQSLELAML